MMVSSQDNLSELRSFINGASRPPNKTDQLELVRTALNLLQTFPAAREAVLEHFCTVIDSAVAKFVINIENQRGEPDGSSDEDATVLEIHDVLCSFVRDNPEAWAPLISAWSLQLLGHLSSRYAGRAGLNPNAGLNETLRLWMSCRATSLLLDATTQCLTPDSVSALLETSAAHGPSFDWAVAHVGASAPRRVVQRVLACGLRDFAARADGDGQTLGSVVGILGHLAATRADHIREAVLQLFQASLDEERDEELRDATVPYLLRLGSLSPTLLRALTSSALLTLSEPGLLPRLSAAAPAWCRRLGGAAALRDLVVHLALGCERDAARLLLLLLAAACDAPDQHAKVAARQLLELLLQETESVLRSSRAASVPLLACLRRGSEVAALQPLLLSEHPLRLATAVRLLGVLGEQSSSVLVAACSFLLLRSTTPRQLAALARLAAAPAAPAAAPPALALALEHAARATTAPGAVHQHALALWANVDTLLRWESRVPSVRASAAVRHNLAAAARVLSTPGVDAALAHAVAAVLDRSALGRPTVQLTLRLAQAAVDYFFLCVALPTDDANYARLRGVRTSCRLLSRLAALKAAARSQALSELTQRALFGREAPLFGATAAAAVAVGPPPPPTALTDQIHKLGVTTTHAHRVSSAFLSGSLEARRRRAGPTGPALPAAVAHDNTQLLLDVIKAAASDVVDGEVVVSTDAMTMLALLTVQLLSSDVMYNGLPWPDEEFCKVTVERDLRVRRALDERPAAWSLLALLAAHRPSLCYCSVLLRAVCATLLAQWASAGQRDRDALMSASQRLLGVLALGQLLQPPLAAMPGILPALQPPEIVQLLRNCVWGYLRDHVPAPALFQRDAAGRGWRDPGLPGSRPDRRYTDTLRYVMQTNIRDLGTFYSQLFVHKNTD